MDLTIYDPDAVEQRDNSATSGLSGNGTAMADQPVRGIAPHPQAAELPINSVPITVVASDDGASLRRHRASVIAPFVINLIVNDPDAGLERANAHTNISRDGAAVVQPVPGIAPSTQSSELPINVVPLTVTGPSRAINVMPLAVASPSRAINIEKNEPWWLRDRLIPFLKLRLDLPVYYIGDRTVTATDLDPHQNRFRLPTDGVLRNFWPILTAEELEAANLHDNAVGPTRATEEELQGRKKRRGEKHGGLAVHVANLHAGIRELLLSKWNSSGGTVIKGDGYMDFIRRCEFQQGDMVEIWTFTQRQFRLFGVTIYHQSPIYVVITKKESLNNQR